MPKKLPPERQVSPTGLLRWVFREPPKIPPGAAFDIEGAVFDKAPPADPAPDGGARRWILEMHCVERDIIGQAVAQAWIPVPMLTAEQARAQDRAAGINTAGLVVL